MCRPSSLAVAEEIMMSRLSCAFLLFCQPFVRMEHAEPLLQDPVSQWFLEVGLMTRQQLCLKSS